MDSVSIPSDEVKKRVCIRKYFLPDGRSFVWPLILSGISVVIGSLLASSIISFIFGSILLYIGVYFYKKQSSLISDKHIDDWIKEDFSGHEFISRAQDLLRFAELSRDPVLLCGLASSSQTTGLISGRRIGDDGVLRATPQIVTVILCSVDQVGIYQTTLDHMTGNRANEATLEVFYQDVTAIAVTVESESLDLQAALVGIKTLQFSPGQRKLGMSRKKMLSSLENLRAIYKNESLAGILQRDVSKTYRVDVADGGRILIPTRDGRLTRLANSVVDHDAGSTTAQAMVSLREFVRDKKRAYLNSEA